MSSTVLGYGLALLVMALIWLLFQAAEWREKYHYWKASFRKLNAGFLEKEKKITYLKGEVKALVWANGLMQDLEDMEAILEDTNKELAEARENTPEWYKAALLEKIGEVKNLTMLNQLADESNAELVAKNMALEIELQNVCGKIDTLRQQYSAYLEDKALRMPDTMPKFGQIAEPEEQKPVDEHDVLEDTVQHQPAVEEHEAACSF